MSRCGTRRVSRPLRLARRGTGGHSCPRRLRRWRKRCNQRFTRIGLYAERSGHGLRLGEQQSGRHQLRQRLHRELPDRHGGNAIGHSAAGYKFSGWNGLGISCPGTGSCTVTLNADRNVLASFETGDLCSGLVTDRDRHPMTVLAKPAKGRAASDPQFGTTIRRISDVAGDRGAPNGAIRPAYSTIPAWNADETCLILYHREHQCGRPPSLPRQDLPAPAPPQYQSTDLEQFYWHPADPN